MNHPMHLAFCSLTLNLLYALPTQINFEKIEVVNLLLPAAWKELSGIINLNIQDPSEELLTCLNGEKHYSP